MRPRTVAIIQARMKSSRLPGKVILDIAGQPMLVRVVERARRAKTLDGIVVATTTDPSDDAIEALCRERSFDLYRGSALDVLDRFYQAASQFGAEVIVRLTADCPLIDPQVIDGTVQALFVGQGFRKQDGGAFRDEQISSRTSPHWDFAANRLPPPWKRTYPIGLDVEVCTYTALERAWSEAREPYQREHVMPYLYDQEGRFRILLIDHDPDYGSLRWTVDTVEDLALIREIFKWFEGRDNFSWYEILDLFQYHPELAQINAQVQHKTLHDVDNRQ